MTFVPLLEGMETNKAFLGKKGLALNSDISKFEFHPVYDQKARIKLMT